MITPRNPSPDCFAATLSLWERVSCRRPLRLLLVVLAAVIGGYSPALAEEAIERFDADIFITADGTVHVEETIRVRAEGYNIRRGIFRDVSTTFDDAEGRLAHVDFDLISVTRDGRPEAHHTERHSDFIRVYTGSEDVFLNVGTYTYVLTYEVDRQVRWFDGRPELFWNVTGNDRAFPILQASVRLELPGGVAPVRWDAYTGGLNERGRDFEGAIGGDGALVVRTTRRLESTEGFTIVAELPPDAIAQPGGSERFLYFLRDYRGWFIGIFGLLATLGWYLWAWNRVGRDPTGGPIIPLFHPPEGVSAALAGYIRDWGFGGNAWRAFTASALGLAVRGLLVFDQEGKDLVLERTAMPAEGVREQLPAGERAVLDWVDSRNGRAEINRANGKAVAAIGQKFQQSVKTEAKFAYFRRNLLHFTLGLLLSIATVAAILVFGNLAPGEIGLLAGIFFFAVFAGLFIGPMVSAVLQARSPISMVGALVVAVVVFGFLVNVVAGMVGDIFSSGFLSWLAGSMRDNALPFVIAFVFPLLNGVFYYLLSAPTPEGKPVMDQIEGFRLYMETAESGRLNIDSAPEIDAERFEKLLPYAVALDVEKPWANAFAAALQRAHPGDSDPMSSYHPRWRRGGAFSSSKFGRSIGSAVSSATTALSSSLPRSSSSSSGFSGGSGGGGGGRGGGGW